MATRDQINGQNEKMATRNEYVRARDWSIGDRSAIDRLIDERESSDLPISDRAAIVKKGSTGRKKRF